MTCYTGQPVCNLYRNGVATEIAKKLHHAQILIIALKTTIIYSYDEVAIVIYFKCLPSTEGACNGLYFEFCLLRLNEICRNTEIPRNGMFAKFSKLLKVFTD